MISKGGNRSTELPEVVRRHLSSTLGNADHPDAALLTAFAEGTLFRTHRDQVLDHLAACSECNRVVALIAPSPEASTVRHPVAIRHRWFAWSPMRWAGAAAVVAIIVSSVVVGRIGRQTKSPAAPVVVATSQAPSITAQPTLPAMTGSGASQPGEKPSQRVSSSRQPAQTAAASPQQTPAQAEPPLAAQNRPAAPVSGQEAFQTAMISKGPASTAEIAPGKSEPAPDRTPAPPAVPIATAPVWSVSEAGMLQRSNDSGGTWTRVAVPSRAPLRAVFASGQDIWAGGDQGALYHSTDAGQTWLPIVPTANGIVLSADITRIVFLDGHRGWIATRKGDIWTTRDGGATWVLK